MIQVTSRQRYHNATGTGSLGAPTSSQPRARVTYMASWPDGIGRVTASADYGTNGGTTLSRPSTIPTRSDNCLVTSTVFDSAGQVQTTTDPMGTVTYFVYDAVGRETQRIQNYVLVSSSSSASSSGSSSSSGATGPCPSSDDTNVTVLTAYNADGNVSSVTAVNSVTGNQVTQYVYGTTLADSSIASSLLKHAEILPDSTGGSDQITFAYNRQGEPTEFADQAGTTHQYNYDKLGRRTQDRVPVTGAGIDMSVLRIATTYEVRGMISKVTSYDNATVGAGNIVNEVELGYNSFGQLTTDQQSHSGAVVPATTPKVQYAFANGSANTIRPTSMTYPNGRVLNFDYGAAGSMNDALSRIGSFIDNDGATHLANYSYLGQNAFVEVDETQPGLTYTLLGLTPGNDPDTGDIYQGLDRFGRIKDLIWTSSGGSSSSSSSSSGASNVVERIQHGYDRAGNRLWRGELADPNRLHDELYAYDGLYRLKDMQRGTLNAGKTAVSPETFAQCWGLDSTGNWGSFRQDDDGDGTWDLMQGRSLNKVNEITMVNNTVGSSWVTPAYDATGNMTTMPQPSSPGSGFTATYDAWNRLISLFSGVNQVAGYAYDSLKRRVLKQVYAGGVLDSTRHYFYSSGWQSLEERVDASNSADRQFVWGLRYIDDLVLRDRGSERLYGLQDPNWNLTAVSDASGAVQERYGYSAYGVPTVLTPSFELRMATLWDWETRFGGYRWDGESGLFIVRNRYYGPQVGVWLQRDSLGLLAGINLYCYANSRPLNFTDALGQRAGTMSIADATRLAWLWFPELMAKLAALAATNPVLTAVIATATLCFLSGPFITLVDIKRGVFVGNDKMMHCVLSCQLAKCFGSLLSEVIGQAKEWNIDWIIREEVFDSGKFDWEDIRANHVGITCAGGYLNAIPLVSWLIGGVVGVFKGSCYDCCCRELPKVGL